MGLSKKISLENGSEANYFNIDSISFDKGSGCRAVFNWYHSEDIRVASPDAILQKNELDFPGLLDPGIAGVYAAAKAHPSEVFSGAQDS